MKSPDNYPHDGSPDQLIELFLEGLLTPEERDLVLREAATDPRFAGRLELARSIREALRSVPTTPAPADMVPEVLRIVRQDARKQAWGRIRAWVGQLGQVDLRPALATAALAAVIVAGSQFGRPSSPAIDPAAMEALEQIKWTFALVSEVGEKTATHLRDDVLTPHVVGHMQGAVDQVFHDPRTGRVTH